MWYTEEETRDIESSYNIALQKMENGEKVKDDSIRGLKCHTKEGSWKLFKNTRDALNLVLDEQERQQRSRTCDMEEIAKLYRASSLKSMKQAQKRGLKDAHICQKYLAEAVEFD